MNAKQSRNRSHRWLQCFAATLLAFGTSSVWSGAASAQERAIWRADTVVVATDSMLVDSNLVEDQDQIGNETTDVGDGAQINLDSSTANRTHACSAVPCARNPCDFVLEVTGWAPANASALEDPIFVGDDLFEVIALISSETDSGAGASPCASYDIVGGGTNPENTGISTGEWRLEVLLDINADGVIDEDDIDACDADIEAGGVLGDCGVYTFDTTEGGNETETVINAVVDIGDVLQAQGSPATPLNFTQQILFRVRVEPDLTTPAPSDQRLFIKDLHVNVLRQDEFLDTISWTSSFYTVSTSTPSASVLKGQALVVTDGSETARVDVAPCGCEASLVWNVGVVAPPGSADPTSGTAPVGTTPMISAGFETWYLSGTPLASIAGGSVAAGSHTFRLAVDNTAATSQDLSQSFELLVDGADIQVRGQSADRARELPPIIVGEFTEIVFEVSQSEFVNRNSAGTYTWTLEAVPAPELDGLSFSNGIGNTAGASAAALTELTLSGIPEGDDPISFRLSIVDTDTGLQSPAEVTAYSDQVDFSSNYAQDFAIVSQELPIVYQGMTYDINEKFATLQVVGVPGGQFASDNTVAPNLSPVIVDTDASPDIFSDTRFLPPGNERLQLIPFAQTVAGRPVNTFGLDNTALIDIYTNPATPIEVDNAEAGRYSFTVEVLDDALTPAMATQTFEVEVPQRRTLILQAPPRVTEEATLTFTVFGEGGIPTRGTAAPAVFFGEVGANEVVDLANGAARYRYNVTIEAQDDNGDYVVDWMSFGNLPAATQALLDPNADPGFTRAASPVTFSLDLNDPGITVSDDTLRPSAGTGRRYRVTVRAEDAVRREVAPELTDLGADMDPAEVVIRVVDSGGEDTNPNTLNPNRLRQNRYD